MYRIQAIKSFPNPSQLAEELVFLRIQCLDKYADARNFILGLITAELNRLDVQKIIDKFGAHNFSITDEFGIPNKVRQQTVVDPENKPDYFMVNVINTPSDYLEYIKNIRRLNLPGLSDFTDVKKFVCYGEVYKVNALAFVMLSDILGQNNLKVVPVPKEEEKVVSEVGANLGRFQTALDWYKNLGAEEKKNADFVIEFYSKLINNVDVSEMTKQ